MIINGRLPSDPHILLSYVNMKLRDEYSNIESLCDDKDVDAMEIINRLESIGYSYDTDARQFRSI